MLYRADAEEVLWSVLWHQGDLYEATAPAVPFVAAFLADGAHPSRAALLQWLLLVVASCSVRRMNDGTAPRYAPLQAPTWEAVRASRAWLAAAAAMDLRGEQETRASASRRAHGVSYACATLPLDGGASGMSCGGIV
jgi:hypothetical protein